MFPYIHVCIVDGENSQTLWWPCYSTDQYNLGLPGRESSKYHLYNIFLFYKRTSNCFTKGIKVFSFRCYGNQNSIKLKYLNKIKRVQEENIMFTVFFMHVMCNVRILSGFF